jgi:hypothetical protein
MSKPFQFSMRRMFLVVTWLCVAAWSFSRNADDPYHSIPLLWFLFFISAGTGVGAIAGKSFDRALWGFLVAILVGLLTPVVIVA